MSMLPGTTWRSALSLLLLLPLLVGCSDNGGSGPGAPSELAFAVEPASVSDGGVFSPPVAVAVRDDRGNTVLDWSEPVSISLAGGTGGQLSGTSTQTPLAGIAVFDDLRIQGAGSAYALVASSGELEAATSESFTAHGIYHPATLTAGDGHTCALDEEGWAWCWGRGLEGQLGNGDTNDRTIPTPVNSDVRFATLTAYGTHTCGLSTENTVYCWGGNRWGQIGDGSTTDAAHPRLVPLPGPAASIDTGYFHTCALLMNGLAYCWGYNFGGALGIGVEGGSHLSPVLVIGSHDWAKIETGYLQSCGLTTAGKAYCWGPNVYGANGVGVRGGEWPAPAPVVGNHTFTDLVAGGGTCHGETCGVTTDGQVLCWGKNYQRQSGPISDISWVEPTPIQGDPGWVEVVVGPAMVCGFTASGELTCLGDPTDGILPHTESPIPLTTEVEVASVAPGQTHVCVLDTRGEAYCWGSNHYGQLGSSGQILGWTGPRGVWAPAGG